MNLEVRANDRAQGVPVRRQGPADDRDALAYFDDSREEVASPAEGQGGVVKSLDLVLDSVDLLEIRSEHGIDESRHEGPRLELAEAALVLELLREFVDRSQGTVMHGDDEVATHEDVQLSAAHLIAVPLERTQRDQDAVRKAQEASPLPHGMELLSKARLKVESLGEDPQILVGSLVDVDPQQALIMHPPNLVGGQLDLAILTVRVVQAREQRHRTKARTPTTTNATNAIAYSMTRIDRSSRSISSAWIDWMASSRIIWRSCVRMVRPTPRRCGGAVSAWSENGGRPLPSAPVPKSVSYHPRFTDAPPAHGLVRRCTCETTATSVASEATRATPPRC